MAITTTTLGAIIDGAITTIRDVVSTRMSDTPFDLWVTNHDLRVVDASAVGSCFRRFQIDIVDGHDDVPVVFGDVNHFGRNLEVLVAYPVKVHGAYGTRGLVDLRATIDADAIAIWTALYNSDNAVQGSTLIPSIGAVDRSSDDVWFLTINVKAQWFQDTNYTLSPRPDPSDPPLLFGASLWLRSDFGITEQPGGLVSGWEDVSGNERHTQQDDENAWPTLVPSVLNGHSAIRFGPTADGKHLPFVSEWPQSDVFTVYAVVRYVRIATYQMLLYSSTTATVARPYLSSTGADLYKPYVVASSGSATWGTALSDDTAYYVKWAFNFTTDVVSVTVNGGTPVVGNASANIISGNWVSLGSPVGVHHLVCDLFEVVGFPSALSGADETTLYSYITSRYAF